MRNSVYTLFLVSLLVLSSCSDGGKKLTAMIFETSAAGGKLAQIEEISVENPDVTVTIYPDSVYQEILGFGGSFTEASSSLLQRMSETKRKQILDAYFGKDGARYTLTRTQINASDFSLGYYSLDSVEGDRELKHFSLDEDQDDIIPTIKEAMGYSENGFKIIASPWTAPAWMKDNKNPKGGKLLPEYRDTWALFFSKYIQEYRKEGIDIWGITVENEPLGNNATWESMHFTPQETVEFVNAFLAPQLRKDSLDVVILAFDQNRDAPLREWAEFIYKDEESSGNIDGLAVHWYESTNFGFPQNLDYVHQFAPGKHLIFTEGCIDSEVPHWSDDEAWYWKEEATDWGWDWAAPEDKKYHPKYVPVYRYARDIIGSLNNWVEGWIDWNLVLDRQGGPNSARNWAVAPVIVDPENDEVYFTPLYYTLAHFSKFIMPGAVRIGWDNGGSDLLVTAAKNPDGSKAVVLLNMKNEQRTVRLVMGKETNDFNISGQAVQTIVLK